MANEVSNDNSLEFVLNVITADLVNEKGELEVNHANGDSIQFSENDLTFSIPLVDNEKELEDIE